MTLCGTMQVWDHHKCTTDVSMVAMHTVVKGVLRDDRGGMDTVWGKSSPGERSIFKFGDEFHRQRIHILNPERMAVIRAHGAP